MTSEPYDADDMRRQYIEYMEYEDCIDEIFTSEEEEIDDLPLYDDDYNPSMFIDY